MVWTSILGVFLPISGGSLMSGVSGPKGAERSTTFTSPDNNALASVSSVFLADIRAFLPKLCTKALR